MNRYVVFLILTIFARSLFGQTEYFVSVDGNDGNDGLSWPNAKATIHAALDIAGDGDTVTVSNGVYSITAQIAVTDGISVRSVNGPDETIIQLDDGAFRLVLLSHADALFEGFTITGSRRGAVLIEGAGTLSDCILRDNFSDNLTTHGAGVYMDGGGIVRRCRIINNWARSSGGGGRNGGGVYMTGDALVESCIISDNWIGVGNGVSRGGGVYMSGGILRNSLIARNSSQNNSGGVYCDGGTIENCTIVENHTPALDGVGGLRINNGQVINTIHVLRGKNPIFSISQRALW